MKHFGTRFLFVFTFALLSTAAFADKGPISPAGMNWADSRNNTINFFWNSTGNNNQLNSTANDDTVYTLTLPFSFNYYGQSFSTAYISTNGYIAFSTDFQPDGDPGNDNLSTANIPSVIIPGYWDQIRFSFANSRIDTLVIGEAPYRKFIVSLNEVSNATTTDGPLTMQMILFETTNLIKYQFLNLGVPGSQLDGNNASVGLRFNQGGVADNLVYSYNTSSILGNNRAVLFYPSDNLTATGALDVTAVTPSTSNQTFTMSISSLQLSTATNLQNMGKADVVKIKNPFINFPTDTVTVSKVVVDGESFFLGANNPNPPTDQQIAAFSKIATWHYDNSAGQNFLYVRLPNVTIKSSIDVEFQVDIPGGFTGTRTFTTDIFSRIETTKGATFTSDVTVSSDTLIAIPPSNPTAVVDTLLPTNQKFTIRIDDASNNPVQGVPISFAIISKPSGAQNDSLIPFTAVTGSNGEATTQLHLGTKAGQYVVRAFTANTDPQQVDFTATAIPRAPDSILIVSGNNQSGAFGQALTDSVRFRVVDKFENGIADTLITFNPVEGSVSPTSRTANSSGEAATSWTMATLGTTQHLIATAPSNGGTVTSDTAIATVAPGTATQLVLVSLRQISGDSVAAVAGEDATFKVEARDAFNNPVPNATVTFAASPGFSVAFDSNSLITDANGRVTNVASTDAGGTNDSTFFRAILAGQDTLEMHVYHLTYVDGSLTPSDTSAGATVSFSLQVNNPSPRTVSLAQATTLFNFSEGSTQFSAALNSATTLAANGNTTLQFQATVIDANFSSAFFTPELVLQGQGANAPLNGTILLPANSLSLFDAQINFVSLVPDTVTTGDAATFTVQLNNTGSGNVTLNPSGTFLSFGSDMIPLDQSYAIPGGGASVSVNFVSAAVASAAQLAAFPATIILGGTRNGIAFNDTLLNVSNIQVQQPPRVIVSSISVSPTTVSQGQDSVQVQLTLQNTGSNRATAQVNLSTGLTLATSQLSNIKPTATGAISLAAGQTSAPITFFFNISSTYPAGLDSAIASYRFVDGNSGDAVDTTASGNPGTFTVQTRSTLSLLNPVLTPASVLPGQTGVKLDFTLQNSGQAAAVINPGGIDVVFNNSHTITLETPASLPVTITGGTQTAFRYDITVDSNPIFFGSDPLDLTVRHSDATSGLTFTDIDTSGVDTLQINETATNADFQIQLVTVPSSVVQGQSGLPATVRLKNLSSRNIQLNSLSLTPTNPGISGTLQTPLSTITANSTANFSFTLDISPTATPGADTIHARYTATDELTGQSLTDSVAVSPGILTVFQAAQFSFGNLSISPDTVSSGQGNIDFFAVITNGDSTNSPVRVDSLQVLTGGAGSLITAVKISPQTLPQTLFGGQSMQVQFRLSTAAALAAGNFDIQLAAFGTDVNTSAALTDTSLTNSTPLQVQLPSRVIVSSISVSPTTVSQGQDSVQVQLTLQNTGSNRATAQVNLSTGLTLATSQLSNIKPTATGAISLAAGQTSAPITFFFNISSTYPAGLDSAIASYRFVDGNSGDAVDTTASGNPGTFTVQTRSTLSLLNPVLTPASVLPGQTGVKLDFTLQNSGQAAAVINPGGIDVVFNNSHTITLETPASLPVTITGGTQTAFRYDITVDSNPIFFGSDPLDLTVRHSDATSGLTFTDIDTSGVDTLQINETATNADFQIQLVTVPSSVVQGQSGLPATVRLKNLSSRNIQLNSLSLTPTNPGISGTLQTPLSTITANSTANFSFTLDISPTATPGADTIHARYTATDELTGQSLTDSVAVSPGILTVFQAAQFSFGNLSISPDTVSSGQGNIDFFAVITNGDSTNSPVRVDSLQVLTGGAGSLITAVKISPQLLPQTLFGGQSMQTQFRLSVAPNLVSGNYTIQIRAFGTDVNTNSALTGTSLSSILTVQQDAQLQITALNSVNDSAFVGQTDLSITVDVQNTGEAPARLNNVTLLLEDQGGNLVSFTPTLQTLTLPLTLTSGQTTQVQFGLNIPANIVIPATGDSTVLFRARLGGEDLNAGSTLTDTSAVLDSLVIFSQPVIGFSQLFSQTSYNLGDLATLQLQVSNSGGALFQFDAQTTLRLVKENDPDTEISILLNPSPSDGSIAGNSTATIEFLPTQLNALGRFRLFLDVRGSSFGGTLNFINVATQTSITVGGDLNLQQFTITPATVFPGATGLVADLRLANLGGTSLPIDAPLTRLEFRYSETNELLPITATRTDTLTKLPPNGAFVNLQWRFDVPQGALDGAVNVNSFLSFDSGQFRDTTFTSFTIQSDVDIDYVSNSLSPDSIAPGEQVQFRAKFVNRGSSDLLVNADSSFIEFTDGVTRATFQANVSGTFSINGATGAVPDTSEIVFAPLQLDPAFLANSYSTRFRIFGELPNGDTLTAIDNSFLNQITVVTNANLVIDSIAVAKSFILAGEEGVEVRYYLHNNGGSPAIVKSAVSRFLDSLDTDISALWSLQSETQSVDTIAESSVDTLVRRFNVSTNISDGAVKALLRLTYADQRTPNTLKVLDNPLIFGNVDVLRQSKLTFAANIVSPAGAFDGVVSTRQMFEWQLSLTRVAGTGPLAPNDSSVILLDFSNKGFFFNSQLTQTVKTVKILPDGLANVQIWAGASPRFAVLRATVVDTSNGATGLPAALDGPNFLDLIMESQNRADLQVALSGPGIVDTTDFTLTGIVNNIGTARTVPDSARLRIVFDQQNFVLTNGDSLRKAAIDEPVQFAFKPKAGVTSGNFAFRLALDPTFVINDENTDASVFVSDSSVINNIEVTLSAIGMSANITFPAGALDSVLSTRQSFKIVANYQFQAAILDTGRTASIELPPGYSTSPTSINLSTNANGTVTWNIVAPDSAHSLFKTIRIVFSGLQDVGGPNPQLISVEKTLLVKTVRRAALSVSATIIDPPGATDGTFSTGQFFDVRIGVTNSGVAATLDTNTVTVTLPAGYTAGDPLIRRIATGTLDTLRIQTPLTAHSQPRTLSAVLTSAARDENTNQPAEIIQKTDNITGLRTEQRANLAIALSADTAFSTGRNSIPFNVSVTNQGAANISQDSISVEMEIDNSLFQFADGTNGATNTYTFDFVNNAGDTTFLLNSLTQTGSATITARLLTANVQDENDNFPGATVTVSKPDTVHPVSVVESGMINVSAVSIIAPVSGRDTLSTGQNFTLQANVNFSGNVAPAGRTATLSLPPGFSTGEDTVKAVPFGQTTVQWVITAPANVTTTAAKAGKSGEIIARGEAVASGETAPKGSVREKITTSLKGNDNNQILGQDFNITVTARGQDASGGSGAPPEGSNSQSVHVQQRAQLFARMQLLAPTGVLDQTVSTTQPFDVRVWVDRGGEAGLIPSDLNQVKMSVPSGFRIEGGTSDTTQIINIGIGQISAATIRVFAPNVVPENLQTLNFEIETAARDRNTNNFAEIAQQNAPIGLSVVGRAALSLDSLFANASALAPNQNFSVTAVIVNEGDAGIIPGDTVFAKLSFDENVFELIAPDTLASAKLKNKQAGISWQMRVRAAANPGQFSFSAEIDSTRSKDRNNNYISSNVFVSKAAATSGNVTISQSASIAITQTYINSAGTKSLTVSSKQAVDIVLKSSLLGSLSDATATLILPDIFTTDSLSANIATGDSVLWRLSIPDTSTAGNAVALPVKIRAKTVLNDQTIFLSDTDTLFLTVQQRATLAIDGRIASSAFNNTISQGDTLVYEVTVSNQGEAGVLSDPPGRVSVTLGNNLSLLDGETAVKDFALDQAVQWQIKAAENAAITSVLNQIRGTREAKTRLLKSFSEVEKRVDEGENSAPQIQEFQQQTRELNNQLSHLQAKLNALVDTSFVSVKISRRSLDANAGTPADTSLGNVQTNIRIAEPVGVSVTNIAFAQPFVSTEQVVNLSLQAEFSGEVIEQKARILDIGGFELVDGDSVRTFDANGIARWALRAPASLSQPAEQIFANVAVQVQDQNSDPDHPSIVSTTASTSATVEQKALLEFASLGGSSIGLAQNQDFEISVKIKNTGAADVQGSGRVRLSIGNPLFVLDAGTPLEQNFTIDSAVDSAIVTWLLTSPATNNNTTATIELIQVPFDENTLAAAGVNNNRLTVDINMIPISLQVSGISGIVVQNSYVKGQTNIAVLGLALFNPNPGESLRIDSLQLVVTDGSSATPVVDIENLVSRAEVISYDFYLQNSSGAASPPDQITQRNVDVSTGNPFRLVFNPPRELPAGASDSLVIRIDLTNENINRNFSVSLNNVFAQGEFLNVANVTDPFGTPLINSAALKSDPITILSDEPEKIFRNYPNPFGMATQVPGAGGTGITQFRVFMNSAGSATLSIFTVTGRLVWRETQTLGEGLNPRAFTWNGLNGQGKRVVNGVYVAILQAGSQQFQTRVVYLK